MPCERDCGGNIELTDLVALKKPKRAREQRAIAASLAASSVHNFILINYSVTSGLWITSIRLEDTHNQDSREHSDHPQSDEGSCIHGHRSSRHQLSSLCKCEDHRGQSS